MIVSPGCQLVSKHSREILRIPGGTNLVNDAECEVEGEVVGKSCKR